MELMNKLVKQECYITGISFQMKPVGSTRRTLVNNGVLELDEHHTKLADKAISIVDKFYNFFVTNSLNKDTGIDWEDIEAKFIGYYNGDADSVENLDELKEQIRTNIANYLNSCNTYGNIFSASALFDSKKNNDSILVRFAKENPDVCGSAASIVELSEELKGIHVLLDKYFLSRKVIITDVVTYSVANRCVDNFERWLDNKLIFTEFKEKHEDIANRIEQEIDIERVFSSFGDFLSQEGINNYNTIISGVYDEDKKERLKKGYNQIANEILQDVNSEKEDGVKTNNINVKYLKTLWKQPLTESKGYNYTAFVDNKNFMDEFKVFVEEEDNNNTVINLCDAISSLTVADAKNIYITNSYTNAIANQLTGNWNIIRDVDKKIQEEKYVQESGKNITKKKSSEIDKILRKKEYSLDEIEDIINLICDDKELLYSLKENKIETLETYLYKKDSVNSNYTLNSLKILAETLREDYLEARAGINSVIKNVEYNKADKDAIKRYVDCFIQARDLTRSFADNIEADFEFMSNIKDITEDLVKCGSFYNRTRNFITKKVRNIGKKKKTCMGFASSYVSGWVQGSDIITGKDNMLLRKDGKYYYAHMAAGKDRKDTLWVQHKPIKNGYEKLMLKKAGEASKSIPRQLLYEEFKAADVFKDPSVNSYKRVMGLSEPIEVTREFFEIYNAKRYKTEYIKFKKETDAEKAEKLAVHKHDLIVIIDKYKEILSFHKSYADFDFSSLKPSEEYENIMEFTNDVDACTTKLSIAYINSKVFNRLVEKGSIYLFELTSQYIRNGRFNDSYSQYLRALFDEENHRAGSIVLASYPQFFYRPAYIPLEVTHKKGSELINKTYVNGERIPDDIYKEYLAYENGYKEELSKEAAEEYGNIVSKEAKIDLVKDKRYTKEQFSITFSIRVNKDVNENSKSNPTKIVREYLKENDSFNILSVVRGEKHLLYYVVANEKKEILEHGSLNVINDVNYQSKLKAKTIQRRNDRRNWDEDEGVANIKEGYLNCAITEIVNIAKKYNAIIAIENINEAFKDKRSFLDNQVYSKFQTRIEDRLMHYVDKTQKFGDAGSISNPYQMTSELYKRGIQNGILFKIPTNYTSSICPLTGFVNLFDLSGISNIDKEREFLKKMDKIYYDSDYVSDKTARPMNDVVEGRFIFEFDYKNFKTKVTVGESEGESVVNSKWKIGSHTITYYYDRQNKKQVECIPTERIKDAFENDKTPYDYEGSENIVNDLDNLPGRVIRELYEAFIKSMQLQTSRGFSEKDKKNGWNDDVLISPVVKDDMKDMFLDSLEESKAYNLLLKTLLIIDNIKEEKTKISLSVYDWLNYMQS